MRRRLSSVLVVLLILQLFFGGGAIRVQAGAFNDDLSNLEVTLRHQTGQVVLGRDTALELTISNTHTVNFAFNVGYKLHLPDGLELIEDPEHPFSSAEFDSVTGEQIVVWDDVKDLAPTEDVTYTIQVKSLEHYRVNSQGGSPRKVPFHTELDKVEVHVMASDAARELPPATPSKTAEVTLQVVPLEVRVVESAVHHVKGAGPDAEPPSSGDEWGAFTYTVELVNNTREATTGITLSNAVDGALQAYDIANDPDVQLTADKRTWTWNVGNMADSESRQLTFNAAFLDYDLGGKRITHGTSVTNTLNYAYDTGNPTEPMKSGSIEYTATAMDIIVSKSVDKETVQYGDTLLYTITVKSNEYYLVEGVVITDTIGDGQTFKNFVGGVAGEPANPTYNVANGETVISWNLGDLGEVQGGEVVSGQVVTLQYETTVNEQWNVQYGGGPVFAADVIDNSVEVSAAYTEVSGNVSDSDATQVTVKEPGIRESILLSGAQVSQQEVAYGDNVEIEIIYDATNVGADQHDVTIYNYLPMGTSLIGEDLSIYAINGEAPEYVPSEHLLVWELGDLPLATSELSTTLHLHIDVPDIGGGLDKGAQNLVILSYANSPERITSKRDSVKLEVIEPELTISRTIDGTPANPGDSPIKVTGGQEVEIAITLENIGLSTAYNVELQDILPPELTNPAQGSALTPVDGYLSFATIASIDPGNTATVTYTADVIEPIGAEREINHQAKVTYDGREVTPYESYETLEQDHVTLQARSPEITKQVRDTSASDASLVRIGDWVVYELHVTLEAGLIAYQPQLVDMIPEGQTYVAAFSSYDGDGTGTGSLDAETVTENEAAGTVTITGLSAATLPSGQTTYTYYMKTTVDDLEPGQELVTQQASANFVWNTEDGAGKERSVQSGEPEVIVGKPQLQAALSSNLGTMTEGDVAQFTLTITNIGQNTAYNFTPTVTIPEGFTISNIDSGTYSEGDPADPDDNMITFDLVNSLSHSTGTNVRVWTFDAELVSVKSSGSQVHFVGSTGTYYPHSEETTTPLDPSTAQRSIGIPSVTVEQAIDSHTNAAEALHPDYGEFIRPGDEVVYRITVTVPAGTIAENLIVTDILPGELEYVSAEESEDHGAGITHTDGVVTIAVGTVDASGLADDIVREYTIKAQASTSEGDYESKVDEQINNVTVAWGTGQTDEADDVSIHVLQPELKLGTINRSDLEFNNETSAITVTVPLINDTYTTAYNSEYVIELPTEFELVDPSLPEYDSDAHQIRGNVDVAAKATHDLELVLQLNSDELAAAGLNNIPITASIEQYESRKAGDRITYTPGISKQTALNIAGVSVEKIVTGTSSPSEDFVRPGDTITYKVTVTVPDHTTAYDVKFQDILGLEQSLVDLQWKGDSVLDDYQAGVSGEPNILQMGDLTGGDHIVIVRSEVRVDQDYSSAEYTYSNEAKVTWQDGDTGGATDQTSGAVRQPKFNLNAVSVPPALTSGNATSEVSVTVNNESEADAYDLIIEVPIPLDVDVSNISDDGSFDAENRLISWEIEKISGQSSVTITFQAEQNSVTSANGPISLTATMTSYAIIDGNPIASNISGDTTIAVTGAHTLDDAAEAEQEGKVGDLLVFEHVLTNTGAGKDTYVITGSGGYASVLKEGGAVIARDDDGDGAWDAGDVEVTIERNSHKTLQLEITVPETAPKGKVISKQLTSRSKSDPSQTDTVTDQITVIGHDYGGVEFDGIVLPKDEHDWQSDWAESIVGSGASIHLVALTSHDITSVEASIKQVDGGYIGGTDVTPIKLVSSDELGQWETTYTLPSSIQKGSYYVEFRAYNSAHSPQLQDEETQAQEKRKNNTFRVDDPSLGIDLKPGETTVTAGNTYDFELTIDNHFGAVDAYQFVPYVVLPEGLTVTEVVYGMDYDASTRKISFYSNGDAAPYDLPRGESLELVFTLQTAADISADERFNIAAGTGSYYSAPVGGEEYDEATAYALMTTGTVKLTKALDSTTNLGSHDVRPGDQIVYEVTIDIPDDTVVSKAVLTETVNEHLVIEKIVINGNVTTVHDQTFTQSFPALPEDTVVYVHTRVVPADDTVLNFTTQSTSKLTWESKYRSYEGESDELEILHDGVRPDVAFTAVDGFISDHTTFASPEDTITYEARIVNNGTGVAYGTTVVAEFPAELQPVEGSYGPGDYNEDEHTITWTLNELVPNEDHAFTFKLIAKPDTPVSSSGQVEVRIDEYQSTPHEEDTVMYSGDSRNLPFGLASGHGLSGAYDVEVRAGETVTFAHQLTNTGAGSDTFTLQIQSKFPLVVKSGDTDLGAVLGESNVWTVSGITLAGGAKLLLDIEVTIPTDTPKSEPTSPVILTLTAKGELSSDSDATENKLLIVGETLDGWVSDTLWSSWSLEDYRDLWQEPVYLPESAVKLSAITSADVQEVHAEIWRIAEPGMAIDEVELSLYNPDTYIADGYKQWYNASYTLSESMGADTYFAAYWALDGSGNVIEEDRTPTADIDEAGYNNTFTVKSHLDLIGTVSDQENPSKLIAGATVTLQDLSGQTLEETTTDGSGFYQFKNVAMSTYVLAVTHPEYADYTRMIRVYPASPADTQVRKDVALSGFEIEISANPSTIIGDGEDETILTVTVTDKDGHPLVGVDVELDAEIGTFFGSPEQREKGKNTARTDGEGKSRIVYRSDKIEGIVSQEVPVTIKVTDPTRKLEAEETIYVIFAPGAIRGTVIDQKSGLPVDQALVYVTNEYGFHATQVTGPDGKYKIAIPRGEVPYQVAITKPVMINGVPEQMTFSQTALPDIVDASGYKEYPSINTATGILLEVRSDRTEGFYDPQAYSGMRIEQIRKNETDGTVEVVPGGLTGTIDPATGIYHISNLPQVADNLLFRIVREVPMSKDNPQLQEITLGTFEVKVGQDGDIIIGEQLIDPYGTITDAVTGKVIEGVEVTLYYADTQRNVDNGKTPGTLVPLPLLESPPFPPANNANPHLSDTSGFYAWMVFPESDYYIIATKPGYHTYNSEVEFGIISVEYDIVRHDFEMDPIRGSGGTGASSPVTLLPDAKDEASQTSANLAVSLFSEQAIYGEQSEIKLTIQYLNRSNVSVSDALIRLNIPHQLEVFDAAGGSVQDGVVTWSLGKLQPRQAGEMVITLKASESALTAAETIVDFMAEITSLTDPLIELADDKSRLSVMVYSDRFGESMHKRYIKGVPDGTFRPDQKITRAEIAAIFSRILDLEDTVQGKQLYDDVDPSHWAAEYIEAATYAELFTGLPDGTFRPDQAITRAELTKVIANYLKLEDRASIGEVFADTKGNWAANVIAEVQRYHIVQGYLDGTFKPDATMIRSEAITMINRLQYRGPLTGAEPSFPDVPASHWAIGHVEESTRTHEYTRNPDGSERMTKFIPEALW